MSAAIEAYEFEQELLSQCCDEDDFIAMEDILQQKRDELHLQFSSYAIRLGF
jgi:hypothetical protein